MTYEDYKRSGKFDDWQLHWIGQGFKYNLSEEQVALYAKPELGEEKMEQLFIGFKSGYSDELMKLCINPKFNTDQIEVLLLHIARGLPYEQLKFCADPKFDDIQMMEVCLGFYNNLSQEQIELYAKPEFNSFQMAEIRLVIMNGMSEEKIKLLANPEFTFKQIHNIWLFARDATDKQFQQVEESIDRGLSYKQFSKYMNLDISSENMRMYRTLYKLGYNESDINALVLNKTPYNVLKEIKFATKYIDYFGLKKPEECETSKINAFLAKSICTCKKIHDTDSREIVKRCIEYKMTPQQVDFIANPKFNSEQMKQIAIALLNNLSINEIDCAVSHLLTAKKIAEICEEKLQKMVLGSEILNKSECVPASDWFDDIERGV